MANPSTTDYITQVKTNPSVKRLEQFLSDESLKAETKSPYSNITDQGRGRVYKIPCGHQKMEDNVNNGYTPGFFNYRMRSTKTKIEEFFDLYEEARISGATLNFAEKQYYTIEGTQKVRNFNLDTLPSDTEDDQIYDYDQYDSEDASDNAKDGKYEVIMNGEDGTAAEEHQSEEESVNNNDEIDDRFDREVEHSGIMLDFDIFQRSPERQVRDTHYYEFMYDLSVLLAEVLDWKDMADKNNGYVDVWGAFIVKPEILPVHHPEYGDCYKDGFHMLLPGIQVTKQVKKYIIHLFHERGLLVEAFRGCEFLNPWTNVLDPNSRAVPVLLLGSSKRGKPAYLFDKIYHVGLRLRNPLPMVKNCEEFNPLPAGPTRKVPDPRDRRKKVEIKPVLRYKYNLAHELSLHYERPDGLIKKFKFDANPELATEIRSFYERREGNIIGEIELRETENRVTDLTIRNSEAAYLRQILDIISEERVRDYEMWKAVVIVLARANPEYRPLAVWFSQRYPSSYVNNAVGMIDSLFEWVEKMCPTVEDEEALDESQRQSNRMVRTVRTLYDWAKQDNPKKYYEIQNHNAFMVLYNLAMKNDGDLNDANLATVLWTMFRNKFVYAINPRATNKQNQGEWYEFVLPTDKLGRDRSTIYKYRHEPYPYTLDDYIGKKLPDFIANVREWVQEQRDREDATEEQQKYYDVVYRKLRACSKNLGNSGKSVGIIKKCQNEFLDRGFVEQLDKDCNVMGVGNGVLRVFPRTELIQQYHDIPIMRHTKTPYVPYDPKNPYIKELEVAIRDLFNNEYGPETDAHDYTMMYLSSTLDGRTKVPLLYIWLGEGGNGKSFLLELHINTLGLIDSNGYGTKLPVTFLTGNRPSADKSNPAYMVLKSARFSYFSESEKGDVLRMGNIKEITSETLSGRGHHEAQSNFRANCHYVFCSNHDPRVHGSDHGTWRRILVYRFKMKFVQNPNPECWEERKQDSKWIDVVPYSERYKQAYLSILVHWYEKYRDRYSSNLNNIPKPTIDYETSEFRKEQDTLHRFIEEKVIHVGEKWNDEPTPTILLEHVAKAYGRWFAAEIEDTKVPEAETKKLLKASKLKRWIEERFRKFKLVEHIILSPDQWWDRKRKCVASQADRADNSEDWTDNEKSEESCEQPDETPNEEPVQDVTKKDNIINEELNAEFNDLDESSEDLLDDLDD